MSLNAWDTRYELPLLRILHAQGMTPADIHEYIPTHTVRAIAKKGYDIGLSWRRTGSRRGLVLGQPRGVSLTGDTKTHEIRELVLVGRLHPQTIVARLSLRMRGAEAICPLCGKEPIAIPVESDRAAKNGVCVICYRQALVDALNRAHRELMLIREQNAAKQRNKRLRDEMNGEQA